MSYDLTFFQGLVPHDKGFVIEAFPVIVNLVTDVVDLVDVIVDLITDVESFAIGLAKVLDGWFWSTTMGDFDDDEKTAVQLKL